MISRFKISSTRPPQQSEIVIGGPELIVQELVHSKVLPSTVVRSAKASTLSNARLKVIPDINTVFFTDIKLTLHRFMLIEHEFIDKKPFAQLTLITI